MAPFESVLETIDRQLTEIREQIAEALPVFTDTTDDLSANQVDVLKGVLSQNTANLDALCDHVRVDYQNSAAFVRHLLALKVLADSTIRQLEKYKKESCWRKKLELGRRRKVFDSLVAIEDKSKELSFLMKHELEEAGSRFPCCFV